MILQSFDLSAALVPYSGGFSVLVCCLQLNALLFWRDFHVYFACFDSFLGAALGFYLFRAFPTVGGGPRPSTSCASKRFVAPRLVLGSCPRVLLEPALFPLLSGFSFEVLGSFPEGTLRACPFASLAISLLRAQGSWVLSLRVL